MNMNTAIFLVNSNCRAISVAYETFDEKGNGPDGKPVHVDTFKTFDGTIQKGDLVLGETMSRHNFCVYKVFAVDIEVDHDKAKYIPWVIGKLNGHELKRLQAMEEELLTVIRIKDKERRRAELAETMLKDYGSVVNDLAIANIGSKKQSVLGS